MGQKITGESHGQHPSGEWVNVDDQGCVSTGRRIKVVGDHEIVIDQAEFVHGRLAIQPRRDEAPTL